MALSEQQLKQVAQRWLDAINSADVDALDDLVAYDVVDHSRLVEGHGTGCDGYKRLVQQLHDAFPGYRSELDSVEVNGDLVRIRHTGRAPRPAQFSALLGTAAQDPAMQQMDFKVTSMIRVNDEGKIVEHWAAEGPFGQKTTPDQYPEPATGRTGTPALNKLFMQQYVKNVIDAMAPENARYYFTENFHNHDPAPGEEPGLQGVINFIASIFAAFSEFQTTIEEQVAEDDLVVGRWSQTFVNTGPYLGFPASGRRIHIGGITITRVRDDRIFEEWEARDALSLLTQMGIESPLGPLDDGGPGDDGDAGKEIARRYFYSVWERGELNVADEIFAADFVNNSLIEGQRPGLDGVKQLVQAFRTGFPDGSVSVDLQAAEGTRIATRYTFRGTHRGRFRGVAATGKRIEVTGISIYQISGGKITAHWGFFDDASLVAQLGLIQYPTDGGTGTGEQPPEPGPAPQPEPGPAPQPGPWGSYGDAGTQ
jgi:steroid delta-isomerase-like uncharacterized protein